MKIFIFGRDGARCYFLLLGPGKSNQGCHQSINCLLYLFKYFRQSWQLFPFHPQKYAHARKRMQRLLLSSRDFYCQLKWNRISIRWWICFCFVFFLSVGGWGGGRWFCVTFLVHPDFLMTLIRLFWFFNLLREHKIALVDETVMVDQLFYRVQLMNWRSGRRWENINVVF